jgi:hypothetical protein
MAKIKLNPIVEEMSGGFGNIVFRARKGKTVMCRKPDLSNIELSDSQVEHQERFRQAVAYGRTVMADPDKRAMYEQAAERKDIPVFALTVADFFNVPSIQEVDLSAYKGMSGDLIRIKAMDDFGVANVHVTLTNALDGTILENGDAVEPASGSGLWVYTATVSVPAGSNVSFSVAATDYPGGTALNTQSKSI